MSGPDAIPDWAALARMAREKDAIARQGQDFQEWLRGDESKEQEDAA